MGARDREFRMDMHTLLHSKCITNKDRDGRGVWGRMDTCVCMAESLCSSLETIMILLIGYTPIQNLKKFFFKIFLEKEMATHSSISCLGSPMDKGAW